jgi:allene oxide cyclase-like protein
MRRSIGLVILAGAVLGVATVASAGESGDNLVLTEKIVNVTQLDLGGSGWTQGDRAVYRSDLLDKDGKPVGTAGGECVVFDPKQEGFGVTNCLGYMNLAGGQLVFSGLVENLAGKEESGTVAITGGTGQYAGARGTLHFEQTAANTFRDEIHLID